MMDGSASPAAGGACRRGLGWFGIGLGAGVALAGCLDLPRSFSLLVPGTVRGVPTSAPWIALPLRAWIAPELTQPQGIMACADAACPARLAIGVFSATGADARMLAAILDDPQKLRRALEAEDAEDKGPRRAIRTVVAVEPWTEGAHRGFTIRLARADGSRAAHGAVLAERSSDSMRVVIAIGADAEAVRQTARDVAAASLR